MSLSTSSKIGIIGSGAMGSGIAQLAASAGHEVMVYDQSTDALDKASKGLQKILNKLAAKGKITDAEGHAIFSRIYLRNDVSGFEECDLIIEAVVENLDIKQDVFANLEIHSKPDCILATNTSSLPITSIAAACSNPNRVVGIHFFNPAPVMKLVEIIPAVQTDKDIVDKVTWLIETWGKRTVLAKDTPGFIVNRIARPFYSESLRIFDEGIAIPDEIDDIMTKELGFRMGPFTLMDFIGHDVNYRVTESMFNAFHGEPRYKPSFSQQRLLDAGYHGRKAGRGFYTYPRPEEAPEINIAKEKRAEIANRVLCMLINEAADALHWNIATAESIDIAMTKGVNYPKGLLSWADELGIQHVVDTLQGLYNFYQEERYRCSPGLRKAMKAGGFFKS